MDDPLLKIEKVSKSYGRRIILKDITIDVRPGEILGIIGASGTGKTTLLNTIIGFIRPEAGDVKFKRQNLISTENSIYKSVYKAPTAFKNIFGFAAQVPSFYEKLTVQENLEYFGELYNLSRETLQANVNTLLKLMNLENSKKILGKNLSGGMERRLDIACALIHNPHLLILDEPTADLDPVLRGNIWKLIEKINSKGTTIILSSHHLNEIEALCSRIVIIKDGEVNAVGSAEELKAQFTKDQEIRIETYPGDYEKLGKKIARKFKNKITMYKNKGNELLILSPAPQEILNDVIKEIEKEKEKVISLRLEKPSLDQLFISLSEEKK